MQITDEMRGLLANLLEAADTVCRRPITSDTLTALYAARERVLLASFGDPPPPPNTTPVRVAVAFDADGVNWAVESIEDYRNDEAAWVFLADRRGFPIRSCLATIHAPLPAVPEVAGVVSEP